MAVPKKKTSKSRRDMRRSHHALKTVNVIWDETLGTFRRPHHLGKDGKYNGNVITSPKEDSEN